MDYSELKRLAEAATPGPWQVVDGHYPSFKEITGPSFKISCVMWATDLTEDDYQKRIADLQLIAAASPDVVLGLLAEVEKLQSNIDERTGGVVRLMTERDTLRTQNQALLEALKYHMAQTRPIQQSIDAIAAAEGKDV